MTTADHDQQPGEAGGRVGVRANITITLVRQKMAALEILANHWNMDLDDCVSELIDRALLVEVLVRIRP